MDAECATDNVWASPGHRRPNDNIPSQASLPQHHFVEPVAESTKKIIQNEAAADDDQQAEKMSNIGSKLCEARKTIAVKAWRARYALLVIFGYACWMILTLLMIDAAVVGVRGLLMPIHTSMTYRIGSIRSQQSFLLDKCQDLQEVHLHKRPFDTHLKCLTRAANIAQDHYADLAYHLSPVVAESTTKWAQSECDRIIFSPVPIPRTGWHILWKTFSDHAGAALYRCKDMVAGLVKVNSRRSKRPLRSTRTDLRSLPLGYHLDCNDVESLCRLSFRSPTSLTAPDTLIEEVKLMKTKRDIHRIIEACRQVNALIAAIRVLIPWMNFLVLVLTVIALDTVTLIEDIPPGLPWKIIGSFAAYLLSEVVFTWMYFWHLGIAHEQYRSSTTTTATYANFGAIFVCCAELGTTWWARSISFHRLLWAFREVRTIYFETSEESIRKIEMDFSGTSKSSKDGSTAEKLHEGVLLDENAVAEGDRADDTSETAPDRFASSVLHISPNSPLHEDVKRMREYLHQKQAMLKLKPKALRPHGDTLTEFVDNTSPSPNSDLGWTVVTSPGDETIMPPIMDDQHDDDEYRDAATEAVSVDEEETVKDCAANSG
ncbi:uncharacterized protein N0V89_006591 [Didymosphaeria variabile]|uniref:Uncharacterized protein n=1 Tax=Didymosphaeria variabile TaxID=1932322 RepID=A0A9W9C9P0_9PLEO|nr:uncharacterized protein N0V89_006591 [Didymosphaeria variabile]KAJ4351252.1 hypothetical protein N0V89_006591 [Didymosphaeria variabile]